MKDRIRILVVDDEFKYVWTMRIVLEAKGYEVIVAKDGKVAVDLTASEEPDVVILDIKMPILDGYEACYQIRKFSTVPIIMLTALAEDENKVKGLDAGADDYVTKPFSADELLARIRAVLRRVEYGEPDEDRPPFEAGNLRVDFESQRVFLTGQEIHLTSKEYHLLRELVVHAGQVLMPEYLLERVWGLGYEGEDLLLRQVIHRLRRKIETDPEAPQRIETRIGMGYVFIPHD